MTSDSSIILKHRQFDLPFKGFARYFSLCLTMIALFPFNLINLIYSFSIHFSPCLTMIALFSLSFSLSNVRQLLSVRQSRTMTHVPWVFIIQPHFDESGISNEMLLNALHEFHETCLSITFIVLVNSHQR